MRLGMLPVVHCTLISIYRAFIKLSTIQSTSTEQHSLSIPTPLCNLSSNQHKQTSLTTVDFRPNLRCHRWMLTEISDNLRECGDIAGSSPREPNIRPEN